MLEALTSPREAQNLPRTSSRGISFDISSVHETGNFFANKWNADRWKREAYYCNLEKFGEISVQQRSPNEKGN